MLRVHVPGLCGLSLRVCATTNGASWHSGVVNLSSHAIETADGTIIPRSQVHRLRHDGVGTWIDPLEAREVVLLLSMIGGMPHRQLLAMVPERVEPQEPPAPKRPRGRPCKHPQPDDPWEIPSGLAPGVLHG